MADQSEAGPTVSREVQRFALKACIAALLTVIAADWIVQAAIDRVEDSAARAVLVAQLTLTSAAFWEKVENELDNVATKEMPPAQKQRLLRDIDLIIARYRPFVDEVQTRLKEPPAGN